MPFHSQLDIGAGAAAPTPPAPGQSWPERSCAIACVAMVLGHHGRPVPVDEALRVGLELGGFDAHQGWRHSALVAIFRRFGLAAYRRNWRLLDGREHEYLAGRPLDVSAREELDLVRRQQLDEGFWRLAQLVSDGVPVIVSVHRPWGDASSMGHQVVLVGFDDDDAVYHDPAVRSGANLRYRTRDFFASWKGTAIVVVPPTLADSGTPLSPRKG